MDLTYSGLLGPRLRRENPAGIEQLRILPRRSWNIAGLAFLGLIG